MIPLQSQVLLKVEIAPDEIRDSGLTLPNFKKKHEDNGIVVSVGKDVKKYKTGDRLKFYAGAGYKVNHKKQEHLLIARKLILGKMTTQIKFDPNDGYIVIDEDRGMTMTDNGIKIPDTLIEKPYQGTVVCVFEPYINDNGVLIKTKYSVGDRVNYQKYCKETIKIEKKLYLIVRNGDIFGKL